MLKHSPKPLFGTGSNLTAEPVPFYPKKEPDEMKNTLETLIVPTVNRCLCGVLLVTPQERADDLCTACADGPACADIPAAN